MSFYLIYVIFRRAISSSAGQKSLTSPPKVSMLFTPLNVCVEYSCSQNKMLMLIGIILVPKIDLNEGDY